ncbi:MAG: hypothetical protein L0220_19150 [Acidobacteria bacterium]|nr:hypothetical protein [Acidobacteriota bacterium]
MPSKKAVKRIATRVTVRRSTIALTTFELNERESQLIDAIVAALSEYNLHRTDILDKAFSDGGSALVMQIEDARNALKDAYYELVRTQLDRNHQQYALITEQAKREAKALEQDIRALRSIGEVIGKFGQIIDTVGRILIVLGL